MKKSQWIPLVLGEEISIPIGMNCLVTRKIKNDIDVTKGLDGWNFSNNGVLAYKMVPDMLADRRGWKSEYWEDESPESGWYLVSMIETSTGAPRRNQNTSYLYYDSNSARWLAVPEGREVFAFFPAPNQYEAQKKSLA